MKKFENGKMSDMELENVAGGTHREMDMELENVAGGTHREMVELHSAITPNPSGLGTHIPGLSEITKQSIIQKLKDKYGIEAHIDIGWLGLGIASENNTYKDIKTGNSLTHSEVMKRLGK